MIISDLSYWQSVELETSIVGGITVDKTVDVDKEVNIDTETDLNIDVDTDIDKDLNINLQLTFDVTGVGGNTSDVYYGVTALGENSVAEADLSVVATDNLSEVSGSLFAAVS